MDIIIITSILIEIILYLFNLEIILTLFMILLSFKNFAI